jgi:Glyoxalase-like domain
MSYRWLTVFLDFPADSFGSGVGFWRAVTGSGLSAYRGTAGEFATLLPPDGDAYLRVQRLAAGDGGCHLDLHVDIAREPLADAAERARVLGARLLQRAAGLIVAESPGGFAFCLVTWDGEHVVPSPLPADGRASRVDTLCIDVPPAEFERECAFWAALTGWDAEPAPLPGYAFLRMAAELPIRIILQRIEHATVGQRARAHIDFGSADPAVVTAHVALGAHVTTKGEHWTVLADPAGREYCLVNRDPID